MSYLTYIFPVLAAFFVIMVARRWMPAFADSRLPADPETGRAAKPRFGFESREGRLEKLDALLCLIITVCYAVVAFTGLGDTTAPQSWCRFTERGRYALIDLGEEYDIDIVRYYTGLHTGRYEMQFSTDGTTWWDAGTLEQEYADLFK